MMLILGVVQQFMYETKIHDIDDLWKHVMQTWSDFDQDIIDTAIDQQRRHLRSCVRAGGGHLLWHNCSFMRFTRTFYETVNEIGCT